MGIKGLLPFLKKCAVRMSLKQLNGYVAAVDAYCWIHRAVYSCAMDIGLGNPTDKYVDAFLKYLRLLLDHNIKPILVFDGSNLPSKKLTDDGRRAKKEEFRKKAAQFLLQGDRRGAQECFERCIDVTPEMAHRILKAARNLGVDCIVAPYEADAELFYLVSRGFADFVITEDSDLLAFGTKQVLLKLDLSGNGTLITWSAGFGENCCGMTPGHLTPATFRYMCIMAGCDYFPGIPGIGLTTAAKIIKQGKFDSFRQLLSKLGFYIKLPAAAIEELPQFASDSVERVTPETRSNRSRALPRSTIDAAVRAERTFRLQVVFDPASRKRLRATDPTSEDLADALDCKNFDYAGKVELDPTHALQVALGNVDCNRGTIFDSFTPNEDYFKTRSTSMGAQTGASSSTLPSAANQITNFWKKPFASTPSLQSLDKENLNILRCPSRKRLHLSIWHASYPLQKIWMQYNSGELVDVYCLSTSPEANRKRALPPVESDEEELLPSPRKSFTVRKSLALPSRDSKRLLTPSLFNLEASARLSTPMPRTALISQTLDTIKGEKSHYFHNCSNDKDLDVVGNALADALSPDVVATSPVFDRARRSTTEQEALRASTSPTFEGVETERLDLDETCLESENSNVSDLFEEVASPRRPAMQVTKKFSFTPMRSRSAGSSQVITPSSATDLREIGEDESAQLSPSLAQPLPPKFDLWKRSPLKERVTLARQQQESEEVIEIIEDDEKSSEFPPYLGQPPPAKRAQVSKPRVNKRLASSASDKHQSSLRDHFAQYIRPKQL